MLNGINTVSEHELLTHMAYDTITKFQELRNSNEAQITDLEEVGKPMAKFVFKIIDKFEKSSHRAKMLESERYYLNQDLEIDSKQRYYYDEKGMPQVDDKLSNIKLKHPLLKKIVNQKTNYLLAKSFTVQADNLTNYYDNNSQPTPAEKQGEVLNVAQDDGNKFIRILKDEYFDKEFKLKLKNLGRESIIKGISWIYVHYDNKRGLAFDRIPAEQVIPFYTDTEKQELGAVIRFYDTIKYIKSQENGDFVEIKVRKAEYITKNYSIYFELENNSTHSPTFDLDNGVIDNNFEGVDNITGEVTPIKFDKVPFVPFRSNFYEQPILADIGQSIDTYNKVTSTLADLLIDTPSSILHIKNYNAVGSEANPRGEAVKNIALYRLILTRDDGDAKYLKNEFDIQSFETFLERLRKDIYEGSSTVDTQEASLGNASASALKFRYADMHSASNDMANEFELGLDNLISFIKEDIKSTRNENYDDVNYDIVFNTTMIVNEEEAVLNAQRLYGKISDETLFSMIPQVPDVQREKELVEIQRKKELREAMEEIALIGEPLDTENGFDFEKYGQERKDELDSARTQSPAEIKKQKRNAGEKEQRRNSMPSSHKLMDKGGKTS